MVTPIKCDLCSNPATVHLTQIVNNKVKKVDLCEDCAQKNGITDPEGFSLMELLSKGIFSTGEEQKDVKACPHCGYTLKSLKKNGRIGCEHCYEAFKEVLEPMMESLHIGVEHKGRTPKDVDPESNQERDQEKIKKLKEEMRDAVKAEHFEEAARIRDQIRKLEKKPSLNTPKKNAP